MKRYLYILLTLCFPLLSQGQFSINSGLDDLNYSSPKEYEIGGMTVSGTNYFNPTTIRSISGLSVGERIQVPGPKITKAINNLWEQKLFGNVSLLATKIEGDKIFLDIHIEELPRLSKFRFTGVRKGKQKDLREEIGLVRGKVVTENLLINTKNKVRNIFVKKGFLDAEVTVDQKVDTTVANNVILTINIKRGPRVKIKDINFIDNHSIKSGKLRRSLSETKRARAYNIFSSSKYIPNNFEKDKPSIIEKYNEKGYRDAKISSDTIYRINEKRISIDISVEEGNQKQAARKKKMANAPKRKKKNVFHFVINTK